MNQNLFILLLSVAPTTLLSIVAVVISVITFYAQRNVESYSDIDKAYFNILELAISNPALRDRRQTATYDALPSHDAYRIQYESYAYICWNIMETIFDRQADKRSQFGISPTWLPVVIEENRLHYHWFCRNLRLFKQNFQEFVMTKLNELEIHQGTEHDLDEIYARMTSDFPKEELKTKEQFRQLLSKGAYKMYLARHKALNSGNIQADVGASATSEDTPWAEDSLNSRVFGYAFVFEPKSPRIAWLDYLAIDPQFRDSGFGTQFVNTLCTQLKGTRSGLMLEVEPATSDDPQILANQQRRISFYNKLDAKQLDVEYLFPVDTGSFPLLLFFRPIARMSVLPKEQIQEMINAAYGYIHVDVKSRDAILRSFIGNVQDNKL